MPTGNPQPKSKAWKKLSHEVRLEAEADAKVCDSLGLMRRMSRMLTPHLIFLSLQTKPSERAALPITFSAESIDAKLSEILSKAVSYSKRGQHRQKPLNQESGMRLC